MLWEGDVHAPLTTPLRLAADRPRVSATFKTMRPISGRHVASDVATVPDRGFVVRRSGLLAVSPSLRPLRRLPSDCPAAEVLTVVVGEMAEVADWLLVAEGLVRGGRESDGVNTGNGDGAGDGMALLFGVLCAAADQADEAAPAPAPALTGRITSRPEVVRHPRETPSQYQKRVTEVLGRSQLADTADTVAVSPPQPRPSSPPRLHPIGFLSSSSPRQTTLALTLTPPLTGTAKGMAPGGGSNRHAQPPTPPLPSAADDDDTHADPLEWLARPQAQRAAVLRRRLSRGRLHAALPRVLRLHMSAEQFEGMWALLRCAHRHSVGMRDFAAAFSPPTTASALARLLPGPKEASMDATRVSTATDADTDKGTAGPSPGPLIARLRALRHALRTDAFKMSVGTQRALAALYQVANAFKAKKFTVKEVRRASDTPRGLASLLYSYAPSLSCRFSTGSIGPIRA